MTLTQIAARHEQAEQEPSKQQEALQELKEWQRAYPLSVFPEPDCTKAQQALESVGITLDSLSASTLRWALDRVMKIVEEALSVPVRTKDLTDDEIEWLVVDTLETWNSKDTMKDFARAVIAADREKNRV